MSLAARLQRLGLLLALLPQLLVMGLGPRTVLCVAPNGHVKVEVSGSSCCSELTTFEAVGNQERVLPQDDAGCGPCSDLRIVVDSRVARSQVERSGELPASLVLCPPLPPAAGPPAVQALFSGPHPRRGSSHPHLVHLRSVLLRC